MRGFGTGRVWNVVLRDRRGGDPFRGSLLARSAAARVGVAALLLVPLWLAVLWAVAVP